MLVILSHLEACVRNGVRNEVRNGVRNGVRIGVRYIPLLRMARHSSSLRLSGNDILEVLEDDLPKRDPRNDIGLVERGREVLKVS